MRRLLLLLALLMAVPLARSQSTQNFGVPTGVGVTLPASCVTPSLFIKTNGHVYTCQSGLFVELTAGGGGSGTVTSIATTAPITGGTITTTGTIACATCAIGPGSSTANNLAKFSGADGLTLADSGIATASVFSTGTNYALLREDFIGMNISGDVTTTYIGRGWFGLPIGTGGWYTYGIATPAGSGGAAADYNHPGVIELFASAANDGVVIHTGKSATTGQIGPLSAYAGWDSTFIFRLSTVAGSTNQVYLGFGAANIGSTIPQVNWFGCRYDQSLGTPDTTVKFVSSASSVLTTANSTIAPGTTWHSCRIRSTVAGTLLMSLDGGAESSISTNVPSNVMDAFFEYKNSVAAITDMWADLFQFYQTVTR